MTCLAPGKAAGCRNLYKHILHLESLDSMLLQIAWHRIEPRRVTTMGNDIENRSVVMKQDSRLDMGVDFGCN